MEPFSPWGRHCGAALSMMRSIKVVGARLYGAMVAASAQVAAAAPSVQGALGRRDLRGLRESAVRSPAQAWQAVVTTGTEMQPSSGPRSEVP